MGVKLPYLSFPENGQRTYDLAKRISSVKDRQPFPLVTRPYVN
ncbi:hypothetical protein [Paenibacillus sp. 22594]